MTDVGACWKLATRNSPLTIPLTRNALVLGRFADSNNSIKVYNSWCLADLNKYARTQDAQRAVS